MYHLFIDDERELSFKEVKDSGIDLTKTWIIVRSSSEAIKLVEAYGYMPASLALDHDLGLTSDFKKDTIMVFLKWLESAHYERWNTQDVPKYTVHTANPNGYVNICSFMESWIKSRNI